MCYSESERKEEAKKILENGGCTGVPRSAYIIVPVSVATNIMGLTVTHTQSQSG